jgi:DNA-directed RNA polymerase specialized sigma24 family protein
MKTIKNLVAAQRLKHELAARRTKLYRIAYSWCHEAALSDDLVQETMFKALYEIQIRWIPGCIEFCSTVGTIICV